MDDGLLISLVQNYEEIFNLRYSQYANQQRRENIWEEIGKALNKSGKQCRERWTRLRDGHRKAINLRKTKSGQRATKLKAPKFDKELSFLVPYLYDEEIRLTNVTTCSEVEIDSQLKDNSFSENTLDITADSPTPRDEIPKRNSGKRQRSHVLNKEPSAAAVLKEYLETTKETENKNDPLTNFFLNMAETVKTFPFEEQVEVKGKLYEIVHAAERREAFRKSNLMQHIPSPPRDNFGN